MGYAAVPKYELTVTFLHDGSRLPVKVDDPEHGLLLEDIERVLEYRLRDYLDPREIQAVRDTLACLPCGCRMSTYEYEDIELELLLFTPKPIELNVRKQWKAA